MTTAPPPVPPKTTIPRRIARPWEKLARKIEKKIGAQLPPTLLPSIARADKAAGAGGVLPSVILQYSGLSPEQLNALVQNGVFQVCQTATEADGRERHLLRVHPRLSEIMRPYLSIADEPLKWAREQGQ